LIVPAALGDFRKKNYAESAQSYRKPIQQKSASAAGNPFICKTCGYNRNIEELLKSAFPGLTYTT